MAPRKGMNKDSSSKLMITWHPEVVPIYERTRRVHQYQENDDDDNDDDTLRLLRARIQDKQIYNMSKNLSVLKLNDASIQINKKAHAEKSSFTRSGLKQRFINASTEVQMFLNTHSISRSSSTVSQVSDHDMHVESQIHVNCESSGTQDPNSESNSNLMQHNQASL